MRILLGFMVITGAVYAENCTFTSDCRETNCNTAHGWWLHCVSGICACNHDSHVSKTCLDGRTATCIAQHGTGCANLGLQWRCIDNNCHCIKD